MRAQEVVAKAAEIQEAISEGATSFLVTEYRYIGVFMVVMAIAICVSVWQLIAVVCLMHSTSSGSTTSCQASDGRVVYFVAPIPYCSTPTGPAEHDIAPIPLPHLSIPQGQLFIILHPPPPALHSTGPAEHGGTRERPHQG